MATYSYIAMTRPSTAFHELLLQHDLEDVRGALRFLQPHSISAFLDDFEYFICHTLSPSCNCNTATRSDYWIHSVLGILHEGRQHCLLVSALLDQPAILENTRYRKMIGFQSRPILRIIQLHKVQQIPIYCRVKLQDTLFKSISLTRHIS